MKRVLTMVLAMVIACSMLGCQGKEEPTADTPVNENSEVDETAAANGEIDNTLYLASKVSGAGDRIGSVWKNVNFTGSLLYRTMFLAEADMTTLKGDLASDYTVSEDGLTYTIQWVGGKWSDGEEITLDDVLYSIGANLRSSSSNAIFTDAFSRIVGADAYKAGETDTLEGLTVEGNTLTITLSTPMSTFPQVLAQFAILPEHCLAEEDPLEMHNSDYWCTPVSSGMYHITEHNAGNYFIMERNEFYEGTAPKIEKIVTTYVADTVVAAQDGLVDFSNTNKTEEVSALSAMENMSMFPVEMLYYRYFLCNVGGVDGNENPVMQDVRVRQAILHAIDRETIVETLFPGLGSVSNSGVASTSSVSIGTEYEYNPEKAKQLLEEANYDFNHTFRILYYYSDQASIDFMDAIAYYLGEIGMKVELINTTNGTQDMFQTREYDIAYKGLSAFDISEWYGEYNSENGNFQSVFTGDTAFDALLDEYFAAQTQEERNDVLKELQKMEAEKVYKLPMFTLGNNVFVNTERVKLPEGIEFGNPWWRFDMHFEEWEIVK